MNQIWICNLIWWWDETKFALKIKSNFLLLTCNGSFTTLQNTNYVSLLINASLKHYSWRMWHPN